MKQAKKNKSLSLPIVLVFLALAFAVVVYGIVRYLVLAREGGLENFQPEVFSRVLWETVPVLIVIMAAGVAVVVYLNRTVSRPVQKLTGIMKTLNEKVLNGRAFFNRIGMGCVRELSAEIATHAREERQLFLYLQEKTASETEKTVRAAVSREIYEGVVPAVTAFDGPSRSVCARVQSAPSVGADFYDAFPLDDDRDLIAVGDVWGKGLPAVFFVQKLKLVLREEVLAGRSLGDAVLEVNAQLCAENPESLAATLFVGIFNAKTGELRYVNAGHPAPMIAGEKAGFLCVNAGAPLGIYSDLQLTEQLTALGVGQGLLLYTDGVVNARNADDEKFGFERLTERTQSLFENALNADGIAEGIVHAVENFCGEATPADDFAVVAVYHPRGVQVLFSPVLEELDRMRDTLFGWLGEDPRKNKIFLACEEVFTNIVNHAGAQAVRLAFEKEDNGITLRFSDDGEPFDPLHKAPDEKDFNEYGEGGMGITIIRQIAGEIFYRTQENLNVLTIRFPSIKGI